MTNEESIKQTKLLEQILDYMKALHKEMREVKVRVSEMAK